MVRDRLMNRLQTFAADERGVTAVEYAMMLVIFSLVVTTALSTLGTSLVNLFQKISTILS